MGEVLHVGQAEIVAQDRIPASRGDEPRDLQRHNPALDGVRGLAIALVLVFHLFYSNPVHPTPLSVFGAAVARAGWIGVDLFFALSGFLVTGILFDSLDDQHYFKNFYGRRALRIMPLYYGCIALLSVLFYSATSKYPLLLLIAYLQNTPLYWHSVNPLLPLVRTTEHFWSLAVEEQFYLLWPVIVFLVRRREALLWVAAAGAVSAPVLREWMLAHGADFGLCYTLTICRTDSLLCGGWLALAIRGPLRTRILASGPWIFALGVAACAGIAIATGNFDFGVNRTINGIGYSLLAVTACGLIAMANRPHSHAFHRLSVRPLRFLGRYSYGIYVWHWILLSLADDRILPRLRETLSSGPLAHVVVSLCVLLTTIPVAMLSFHAYEKPFLQLKRFLNYDRPGFRTIA